MRQNKSDKLASEQMDILRREFPGETGLKRLTEKLVNVHNTFNEVQARNEARGYVYGWDKGRFVVLKYPDGEKHE